MKLSSFSTLYFIIVLLFLLTIYHPIQSITVPYNSYGCIRKSHYEQEGYIQPPLLQFQQPTTSSQSLCFTIGTISYSNQQCQCRIGWSGQYCNIFLTAIGSASQERPETISTINPIPPGIHYIGQYIYIHFNQTGQQPLHFAFGYINSNNQYVILNENPFALKESFEENNNEPYGKLKYYHTITQYDPFQLIIIPSLPLNINCLTLLLAPTTINNENAPNPLQYIPVAEITVLSMENYLTTYIDPIHYQHKIACMTHGHKLEWKSSQYVCKCTQPALQIGLTCEFEFIESKTTFRFINGNSLYTDEIFQATIKSNQILTAIIFRTNNYYFFNTKEILLDTFTPNEYSFSLPNIIQLFPELDNHDFFQDNGAFSMPVEISLRDENFNTLEIAPSTILFQFNINLLDSCTTLRKDYNILCYMPFTSKCNIHQSTKCECIPGVIGNLCQYKLEYATILFNGWHSFESNIQGFINKQISGDQIQLRLSSYIEPISTMTSRVSISGISHTVKSIEQYLYFFIQLPILDGINIYDEVTTHEMFSFIIPGQNLYPIDVEINSFCNHQSLPPFVIGCRRDGSFVCSQGHFSPDCSFHYNKMIFSSPFISLAKPYLGGMVSWDTTFIPPAPYPQYTIEVISLDDMSTLLSVQTVPLPGNILDSLPLPLPDPFKRSFSTYKYIVLNYGSVRQIVDVYEFATCNDMDTVIFPVRPKCYTPHTRYCELFAVFDTTLFLSGQYCDCIQPKDNAGNPYYNSNGNNLYIGPQCQDIVQFVSTSTPHALENHPLTFTVQHTPGFPRPIEVIIQDTLGGIFNQPLQVNYPMFPATIIATQFFSLTYQDVIYIEPRQQLPLLIPNTISTLLTPFPLDPATSSYTINYDHHYRKYCMWSPSLSFNPIDNICKCFLNHFSKHCDLYFHIQPTNPTDLYQQSSLIPGTSLTITWGSYYPQFIINELYFTYQMDLFTSQRYYMVSNELSLSLLTMQFIVPEHPPSNLISFNVYVNGIKMTEPIQMSIAPSCTMAGIKFYSDSTFQCAAPYTCHSLVPTSDDICQCKYGQYGLTCQNGITSINTYHPFYYPGTNHIFYYGQEITFIYITQDPSITFQAFVSYTNSQQQIVNDNIPLSCTTITKTCTSSTLWLKTPDFTMENSYTPPQIQLTIIEMILGTTANTLSFHGHYYPLELTYSPLSTSLLRQSFPNFYCNVDNTQTASFSTIVSYQPECHCHGNSALRWIGTSCDYGIETEPMFFNTITSTNRLARGQIFQIKIITTSNVSLLNAVVTGHEGTITIESNSYKYIHVRIPFDVQGDILPLQLIVEGIPHLIANIYVNPPALVPCSDTPYLCQLANTYTCNPQATNIQQQCVCEMGFVDIDCGIQFIPPVLNAETYFIPSLNPTMVTPTNEFFYGQHVMVASQEFDVISDWFDANINNGGFTIITPQTGSKSTILTRAAGIDFYLPNDNTQPLLIQFGNYIPTPFQISSPILSPCEYYIKNYDTSPTHTIQLCVMKNTQQCHLTTPNVEDICECKAPIINTITKTQTIWFGQYCEYEMTLSTEPLYIGQHFNIDINIELGYTRHNFDKYTLLSSKSSSNDIPIPSENIQQFPPIITIPEPNTLTDVTLPPLYQSQLIWDEEEMYQIEMIDSTTGFEIKTPIQSKYHILEPCSWIQATRYNNTCSTKPESKSGCMNLQTNEIECQCNTNNGYNLNDCRLYIQLLTPPNSNGKYYYGQYIQFDIEWYFDSIDSLHRSKVDFQLHALEFELLSQPYNNYVYYSGDNEVPSHRIWSLKVPEYEELLNHHNQDETKIPQLITLQLFQTFIDSNSRVYPRGYNLNIDLSLFRTLSSIQLEKRSKTICPFGFQEPEASVIMPYRCFCAYKGVYGDNCQYVSTLHSTQYPITIDTYAFGSQLTFESQSILPPTTISYEYYHRTTAIESRNIDSVLQPLQQPYNLFSPAGIYSEEIVYIKLIDDGYGGIDENNNYYAVHAYTGVSLSFYFTAFNCDPIGTKSINGAYDFNKFFQRCFCYENYYGLSCQFNIQFDQHVYEILSPIDLTVVFNITELQLPLDATISTVQLIPFETTVDRYLPSITTTIPLTIDITHNSFILDDTELLGFQSPRTKYMLSIKLDSIPTPILISKYFTFTLPDYCSTIQNDSKCYIPGTKQCNNDPIAIQNEEQCICNIGYFGSRCQFQLQRKQWDTNQITMIDPTQARGIKPGDYVILRWDKNFMSQTFSSTTTLFHIYIYYYLTSNESLQFTSLIHFGDNYSDTIIPFTTTNSITWIHPEVAGNFININDDNQSRQSYYAIITSSPTTPLVLPSSILDTSNIRIMNDYAYPLPSLDNIFTSISYISSTRKLSIQFEHSLTQFELPTTIVPTSIGDIEHQWIQVVLTNNNNEVTDLLSFNNIAIETDYLPLLEFGVDPTFDIPQWAKYGTTFHSFEIQRAEIIPDYICIDCRTSIIKISSNQYPLLTTSVLSTIDDICINMSTTCPTTNGICNPYTNRCDQCPIGYTTSSDYQSCIIITTPIIPPQEQTTCPLVCPPPLVVDQKCYECICTTTECQQLTRTTILYFNPQTMNNNDFITMVQFQNETFYKRIALQLQSQLKLTSFTIEDVESELGFNYGGEPYLPNTTFVHTFIGIEDIYVRPISPLHYHQSDPTTIIITIIINPFAKFTRPFTSLTLSAIQQRFDVINMRLNRLFSQSKPWAPIQWFNTNLPISSNSNTTPLPQLQAMYQLPSPMLTTKCSNQNGSLITTCPIQSDPLSPLWIACSITRPTTSPRISPSCYDYNNIRIIPNQSFSFISWCSYEYHFPQYPQYTTLQLPLPLSQPSPCLSTINITLTEPSTIITIPLQPTASQPHATTPITIIPPSSIITVTVPGYADVQQPSTTVITIGYYPQKNENEYSSVPIIIKTDSIPTPIITTTIELSIPNDIIATKVFYQISIPKRGSSPTTTPAIVTTPPFTILPSCYEPPTTPSQLSTLSSWTTKCENNGQCSFSTQQCQCQGLFEGPTCSIPIEPCSQCNQNHLESCNIETNQCQCKKDFSGDLCQITNKCQKDVNKKCSGNNGYIIFDESSQKCTTTCQCNNLWIGDKCETCPLQCYNNGIRYSQCDRCGCTRGFSGEQCQCQSEYGTITLNGYNQIIIDYFTLLSQYNNNMNDLPLYSIELQEGYNIISNAINSMFLELLQLNYGSTKLNITIPQSSSSLSNESTSFRIDIIYGCDNNNPLLTSSELKQKWENELLTKFSTHPTIKLYFTFPINVEPRIEIIDDLQPIEPTLPPQTEINSSHHYYYYTIIAIIIFIFV